MKDRIPPPTRVNTMKNQTTSKSIESLMIAYISEAAAENIT